MINRAFWLTPRNRLILSLFMGILSAAAVGVYLRNAKQKLQNQFAMTAVLSAKKYIPQGKIITSDLVEERPIPLAYLQPTAFQHVNDLKGEDGKFSFKSRVGFLKGEQLTKSKVLEENALQGLSWALQPEQTALTLRFDLEKAVAGLLQPGDWVSVFVTLDSVERGTESRTKMILPRVQVLAVQDQILDPSGSPGKKWESKNMPSDSILVTLGLSPEEAARGILGADKGRMTLALLSSLSTEFPRIVSVRLSELK